MQPKLGFSQVACYQRYFTGAAVSKPLLLDHAPAARPKLHSLFI